MSLYEVVFLQPLIIILDYEPIALFTLDDKVIRFICIRTYGTIHLTRALTTLTVIPHPRASKSWIFDPAIFTNSTPIIENVNTKPSLASQYNTLHE